MKASLFLTLLLLVMLLFAVYGLITGVSDPSYPDEIVYPTGDEAIIIYKQIVEVFVPIVKPTIQYLSVRRGVFVFGVMDYVKIVEYFRDNDFSEEIHEMEALLSQIPAWGNGQPVEYTYVRTNLGHLPDYFKYLCELGDRYAGKEVEGLTDQDRMYMVGLTFLRDNYTDYWDDLEVGFDENRKPYRRYEDISIETFDSMLEYTDFSEVELEDMNMHSETQEIQVGNDDNIRIRLIVYSKPIGRIGSLDHSWTFIEISHGNKKTVHKLYEQSPNISQDLRLFRDGNDLYLIITGYTAAYTLRPLFVSFWEVSDLQLVKREIFSEVEEIPSGIVRCKENELIIESYESQLNFDSFQDNWEGALHITNDNDDGVLDITYSEGHLIVAKASD